jgi:hypothetical protein
MIFNQVSNGQITIFAPAKEGLSDFAFQEGYRVLKQIVGGIYTNQWMIDWSQWKQELMELQHEPQNA